MDYMTGQYTCKVMGTFDKKSKDGKYTIFNMQIMPTVYHGPDGDVELHAGDEPEYLAFIFGGDYDAQTVEQLRDLGFMGGSWDDLLAHPFAGQEIACQMRVKNGYNQWSIPRQSAVTTDDKRKLDKIFAKSAPKQGNPPQTQALRESKAYQETAAVASPNGPSDEDIPF